jgi:outer membrane protein TolC
MCPDRDIINFLIHCSARFLTTATVIFAVLAASSQAPANPPGLTILDAVRSTTGLNPLIRAAGEDVAASLARRQQASGAFDLRYTAAARQDRTYTPLTDYEHALALAAGIDTFSQTQDVTEFSAQSTMLLRNGISLGPTFDLLRLNDNLENLGGVNTARIDFRIDVPLRRGRGREFVTAPERAAAEEADARGLAKNETIASLVYSTAVAYWQYVGAMRTLEIHRASEQRGAEFLSSVETLIAANRMPGVEVHQARANVEEQKSARIAAEQRVTEARQNLGYAMGLGAAEALSIPVPSEAFPEEARGETEAAAADHTVAERWVARALTLRAGYLAAEKFAQSAETTRTAALNQLLPRFDLIGRAGYSGLYGGERPDQLLYALGARVQGPDLSAGIQYTFARGNHTAEGQFEEAAANHRKLVATQADASNRIAADVVSALSGVSARAAALDRARRAVSEYQIAMDGAKEKLRLAAGSLLDLLTIEQRLTNSQLDLVNSQMQYALSVVQLRYTSGTLLGSDPLQPSLERQVFFTLPPAPATSPAPGEKK